MYCTYYAMLQRIFHVHHLEIEVGDLKKIIVSPLPEAGYDLRFVKDTELDKYPFIVFRKHVEDGSIVTVAFNAQYIRYKDGLFVHCNEHEKLLEENPDAYKKVFMEIFGDQGLLDFTNYLEDISHYNYLELMVPKFGPLVFGQPNGWHFGSGMIGAHGDKCSSYMRALGTSRENVFRVALLFLLTYTNKMDREKHETKAWLKENLPQYLDLIKQAEVEVFGESYYFD